MNQKFLRQLPAVDELLSRPEITELMSSQSRAVVVMAIREVLDEQRLRIIATSGAELDSLDLSVVILVDLIRSKVEALLAPRLRRVVNATGVVIHTNLGRSILPESAVYAIGQVAKRYSNLEYDIEKGTRGSRQDGIREIILKLTKAEDAMVVNNNAAAVLLALSAIAKNHEVIVSRGELVEIGGSFRIPDVMRQSGAQLVEVGTTNKTYAKDYKHAINENTSLLLKVHTSNFKIVGFTAETSIAELVALGRETEVGVMHDLGSGIFANLDKFGFIDEPTVEESIKAGVDILTFSGDKLLGGPQAGIIIGNRRYVEICRDHPLARAVRVDKFTLAALEATLKLYLDPEQALTKVPTVRMLVEDIASLEVRARELASQLTVVADGRYDVQVVTDTSKAGGGTLPLLEIPTMAVSVASLDIEIYELESRLRANETPIVARIKDNRLIFDIRTIAADDFPIIVKALDLASPAKTGG